MNRKLSLVPLTALATLLCAGAAGAAEWHHAPHVLVARGAAPIQPAAARSAAESHLRAAVTELRLEGVDLRFQNDLAVGAHRTVRFTQQHAGLPVIGGSAAVRLTPGGQVKVTVLDVARGLSVSPTPTVSEAAAGAVVAELIGMTPAVPPRFHLAVLPEAEGPGRLVWNVDIFRGSHKAFRYLVDAHRGELAGARPLALDALGRVYPQSSVATPQTEDVLLVDLDPGSPQHLSGWNGNLTVTNYLAGGAQSGLEVEQSLVPSAGEDFLYDPPVDLLDGTDAFAQVGIFYHVTRIRNYFRDTHGIDTSAPTWKLTAVANMQEDGAPLDNAYFSPEGIDGAFASPNLIAIGQGTQFDFADDSDVFLHEFGHYVSGNAINYNQGQLFADEFGLSPWSGSIDEGIADYFACSLNDDSLLGEASLAPLGAARDLTDTGKRCPDDVLGEVHEDGELIGSLGWSLRTELGQALGDELVWGALTTLTAGGTFGDFARGLQLTAADMLSEGKLDDAQLAAIDAHLAARGMDDCDQLLEVSESKPRRTIMLGLDIVGQIAGASCAQLRAAGVSLQSLFHFQSTPAAGDRGIRFTVDIDPQGGNNLEWGLFVRADQHVGFATSGFLPKPNAFDYSVQKITATQGEIVIDATSNPPFDPAKTYYLAIANANCPLSVATITSAPANDPPGEGGSGGGTGSGGSGTGNNDPADPPAEDDSGCSCRAAGADDSSSGAPLAAFAGLALALAAVRRRSRS